MAQTNNTTPVENKTVLIQASEISEYLGVSKTYAYEVIKKLNGELESKGYLVVQGRTSRKYFNERFYGRMCSL